MTYRCYVRGGRGAENADMENAALENAGRTKYDKLGKVKRTEPKKQPSDICCVACFVIQLDE